MIVWWVSSKSSFEERDDRSLSEEGYSDSLRWERQSKPVSWLALGVVVGLELRGFLVSNMDSMSLDALEGCKCCGPVIKEGMEWPKGVVGVLYVVKCEIWAGSSSGIAGSLE